MQVDPAAMYLRCRSIALPARADGFMHGRGKPRQLVQQAKAPQQFDLVASKLLSPELGRAGGVKIDHRDAHAHATQRIGER